MNTDQKLLKDFNEAVSLVNAYTDPLPADLLLRLYAYFKIANRSFSHPGSRTPLINAFKANALIQAKNVSTKEAMEKYIALVNKEIKQKLK
ncbi:acyl-CoA-binding protein [Arenibacter latericius]|uniref:acyl-CoA-binding protein n=1 Tax=Arenibacter latericius TaxID=86104 RepID=UPI0003F69775|nr:acyl-CoA-binding protein [Arenibacter latericius]